MKAKIINLMIILLITIHFRSIRSEDDDDDNNTTDMHEENQDETTPGDVDEGSSSTESTTTNIEENASTENSFTIEDNDDTSSTTIAMTTTTSSFNQTSPESMLAYIMSGFNKMQNGSGDNLVGTGRKVYEKAKELKEEYKKSKTKKVVDRYGPPFLYFTWCMGKKWVNECYMSIYNCASSASPWQCVMMAYCGGKSTRACLKYANDTSLQPFLKTSTINPHELNSEVTVTERGVRSSTDQNVEDDSILLLSMDSTKSTTPAPSYLPNYGSWFNKTESQQLSTGYGTSIKQFLYCIGGEHLIKCTRWRLLQCVFSKKPWDCLVDKYCNAKNTVYCQLGKFPHPFNTQEKINKKAANETLNRIRKNTNCDVVVDCIMDLKIKISNRNSGTTTPKTLSLQSIGSNSKDGLNQSIPSGVKNYFG